MPGQQGCFKHLLDYCNVNLIHWVRDYAADNPHLVVLAAILMSAAIAGPLARRFL